MLIITLSNQLSFKLSVWLARGRPGVYTNFKGTVSEISSDPSYKGGKAQLTMDPLRALSNQVWIRY